MAYFAGADWSETYQLVDPSVGTPYDISTWTIEAVAERAPDRCGPQTATVTIDDGPEGTLSVYLTASQTETLGDNKVQIALWRTDSSRNDCLGLLTLSFDHAPIP